MIYLAWYSEIYMKIMTGEKKVYMESESYAPVFKALIWKLGIHHFYCFPLDITTAESTQIPESPQSLSSLSSLIYSSLSLTFL